MNDTHTVAPQIDSHPDYMARPYNDEPYDAVKPQPDNDEIASKGERVVLYHKRFGAGMHQAVLTIAPHGLQVAGWVIGLIRR